MTALPCLAVALLGLALPLASLAQDGPSITKTAAAASAPGQTDAGLQRTVIEDDRVRIEETRVRGTAQRITVKSKLPGVRPYEIQVAPAGRDPSQARGNAGQRAWSIFDF